MGYSDYDKTLWRFKKQIERKCKRSAVDVELFKLSEQLTINDWREIRGNAFWESYDSIPSQIEKNKFTLGIIKQYLNSK